MRERRTDPRAPWQALLALPRAPSEKAPPLPQDAVQRYALSYVGARGTVDGLGTTLARQRKLERASLLAGARIDCGTDAQAAGPSAARTSDGLDGGRPAKCPSIGEERTK